MLFNSVEFIFAFLPVTFLVYFLLNHQRLLVAAKAWLVAASLFFYGWWDVAYVPLIVVSMIVNFAIGSSLTQSGTLRARVSKKTLLVAGLVWNLGLLAYFKYADFFIRNVNYVADADFDLPGIVLPLAISFFTFQKIAYLVDSYRGETKEYDFLNFSLFVLFFPQLIAGPIVHHKEMMPQFASRWNLAIRYKNVCLGIFIFSMGLFKKVVLADTFAQWVRLGFDVKPVLGFAEAWATSLAYTFQLYFDFSGYTDMAIGAALLFNVRLPANFNSPYKAVNIQDFWRRWHITLSRFLRDYVYIPLGGNRHGEMRTYANLFATFLLGGIWHGASWMFVVWGALHGFAVVVHRFWQRLGFKLPALVGWFITFNFVNFAWVFFRAKDLEAANKVLAGMFLLNDVEHAGKLARRVKEQSLSAADALIPGLALTGTAVWLWLLLGLSLVLAFRNSGQHRFDGVRVSVVTPVAYAIMAAFAVTAAMTSKYSEFIYFNF